MDQVSSNTKAEIIKLWDRLIPEERIKLITALIGTDSFVLGSFDKKPSGDFVGYYIGPGTSFVESAAIMRTLEDCVQDYFKV